jgi:hypothetical protein
MPQEKDKQDQEVDFMFSNTEGGDAGPSRMGGRIGVRMGGINDQDGDIPPDDEPKRAHGNFHGEPEREPSKNEPKYLEEHKINSS